MCLINIVSRIRILIKSLFSNEELYYINGSETLPPPLSQEEEQRLIETIDTQQSRDILIEHNLRLVAYIAKKFDNTTANIEELISIGTIGLIKAISTFNVDKNIKLCSDLKEKIESCEKSQEIYNQKIKDINIFY